MSFRLANVDDRAVLIHDGDYYDLATATDGQIGPDPMDAVGRVDELHDVAARLGELEPTGAVADVDLGPPVPRPRNCFGIGLNYRAHAEETGVELPPVPVVFTKYPSCISGPNAGIELRSEHADYEAELVVVIGRPGRDISAADAWDHVAGVTCGQDVSDRKVQFASKPPHFGLGKSRDGYGPIGPALVSPDLLADRDALSITCDVSGVRRQTGNTSDLIFDVPALIEHISGILTLAPGDTIFTGTPAGVGVAQGRFLVPGDVITTTIEGIGTMTNVCR